MASSRRRRRGLIGGLGGEMALHLDGTSGTYASTPHSEAVNITGDLTLVAKIAPQSWVSLDPQQIMGKRYGDQDSWVFRLTPAGALQFLFWYDESNFESTTRSVPVQDGDILWVGVVLSFDAEGSRVQYYTSEDGTSWQSEGAPFHSSRSGIYSAEQPIDIGLFNGNQHPLTGNIYRAQVYRGSGFDLNIGPTGTLVADFNPADAPKGLSGGQSFTSRTTGEGWTLYGNAVIKRA